MKMASRMSTGFHAFCVKCLPFLLIRCPVGNLHFLWSRTCGCGSHEYCGEHQGYTYRYRGGKWAIVK